MRIHQLASPSRFVAGVALGLAIASGISCTTTAKKKAAQTALDTMGPAERRETFEATARVLDDHPELVDEFYEVARHHGPLLERFLENAASKDLQSRPMAEMAARHLVVHPPALEQVLATSLDFIARDHEARSAMNRAMAVRAEIAADIITDSPHAVGRMLDASLAVLEKKPAARRSTLLGVRKNRQRILAFMKNDPDLAKEIGEEVLREAVKDKPALEKALRGAKIIDDDAKPKR